MKFDVYISNTEEIVSDENTRTEKNTTKRFRNVTFEEVKNHVNNIEIPENATGFYLEIHKSYEEQMDAALGSI